MWFTITTDTTLKDSSVSNFDGGICKSSGICIYWIEPNKIHFWCLNTIII